MIKDRFSNPKIYAYRSFKNDWGIIQTAISAPCIFGITDGFYISENNDTVTAANVVTTGYDIRLIGCEEYDGIILATYPYPENMPGIFFTMGYNGLTLSSDFSLWTFSSYNQSDIMRFNLRSKEFKFYNGNTPGFPINLVSKWKDETGWHITKNSEPASVIQGLNSYFFHYEDGPPTFEQILWLAEKTDTVSVDTIINNYPGTDILDTVYQVFWGYTNCFLRWTKENDAWDTINIDLPNSKYHKEKGYRIKYVFGLGSSNGTKCVLTFDDEAGKGTEFIIFDWVSREHRSVVMPEGVKHPVNISEYTHNNKKGLGIIASNKFWFYDFADTTGIEDTPLPPSFNVFPNPAKDLITITLAIPDVPSVVTISNEAGEVIFTQTIVNTQDIDISAFTVGVYFIKVGDYVEKIVVK